MKTAKYSGKYYKRQAGKQKTKYEFIGEPENMRLGYIDSSGKIKESIQVRYAAGVNCISTKEYLIKMYKEGFLCGYAEEYTIKLMEDK
jgi:hypothetical protein